ncbi:hypothetical protein HJC23_004210 [Cyclotella cryptica]|uniref:CAP-Gly domain-containing protein n=1 Tax=Cyclotella cryptica TaxID=29204 RepID=A0ABD3Q814_9STRA|eukprot:CCRYP_007844-RA/>CCRYP_007844-RA protein AED:0.40 eAED:0.40 QI:0/-1/0/1/-1/1/1/0/325
MTSNIRNSDLLALKSYITAADSTQYDSVASTTIILDLTHSNLHQRHAEIRFDKHDTVEDLRRKIHQKSGTPPHSQRLQLIWAGQIFHEILPETESTRLLGYYNLPHGANVHCIDIDPYSASANGAYEDTSLVEKFVLSEEEYNKRKGTLRDWGRKQKEADPEFSLKKHAREHAELVEAKRLYRESGEVMRGFEVDECTGGIVRCPEEVVTSKLDKGESSGEVEFGPESIQHLSLHARCQVQPGARRGEIAFLGVINELGNGGHWVGVILDEPVGKTDGTVKSSGVRYFEAPGPNRGGFFRGKNVEAGDFPEIDIMAELEDSEDEL